MTEAEKWLKKIEKQNSPELMEAMDIAADVYGGFYHPGAEAGFAVFSDGSGLACLLDSGWYVFTNEEVGDMRKEAMEHDGYDG
jgi:hypothetical protein